MHSAQSSQVLSYEGNFLRRKFTNRLKFRGLPPTPASHDITACGDSYVIQAELEMILFRTEGEYNTDAGKSLLVRVG